MPAGMMKIIKFSFHKIRLNQAMGTSGVIHAGFLASFTGFIEEVTTVRQPLSLPSFHLCSVD